MGAHEPLDVIVEVTRVLEHELHGPAAVAGQAEGRGPEVDVDFLKEAGLLRTHADRVSGADPPVQSRGHQARTDEAASPSGLGSATMPR